jgi:hypothetical protein
MSYGVLGALALIVALALNVPDVSLELLGSWTQRLGITVPIFIYQGIAFVGGAALLAGTGRNRVWPPWRWTTRALLTSIPAAFLVLSTAFYWGSGIVHPYPDHVQGRILVPNHPAGLRGLQVAVLNSSGEDISIGSGAVDTRTGEFTLRYRRVFYDRPQSIRIRRPGCREVLHPMPKELLRSRGSIQLRFRCEEVSP